jgi:hypothetical protein
MSRILLLSEPLIRTDFTDYADLNTKGGLQPPFHYSDSPVLLECGSLLPPFKSGAEAPHSKAYFISTIPPGSGRFC